MNTVAIEVFKTRPEPHRIRMLMFKNCVTLKTVAEELAKTEAHLCGVINGKVKGSRKLMKRLDEIADMLENAEAKG